MCKVLKYHRRKRIQMTRNEAREILMQIMYEMDAAKCMDKETAARLSEERLAGNHKRRGQALLCHIIDHLPELDGLINANSKSWKTGRMPRVDLAIMRLALGEIRYGEDVPKVVAINEAINLAKKYSTQRSSRFIHGVLGAIVNKNEDE